MKLTKMKFMGLALAIAVLTLAWGQFGVHAADKPVAKKMPDIQLQPPAGQEEGKPKANAAPAIPPETVIMKINGEEIKEAQVLELITQMMSRQFGGMVNPANMPPEFMQQVRPMALKGLKEKVVLEQAIKKTDFKPSDADVKAEFGHIDSMIKSQDPNDSFTEQLKKAKAQDPQIEQKVTDQIKQQLQGIKVVEAECKTKIDPSEQDIKAAFDKNPKKWDQVRASHILIPTQKKEGDATSADKDAKTKAEEALKEVKGGKDFAEVAKKYSQDPGSKDNGGDLKYFTAERMVPEFSKAAFGMKKGEVSDLVQTQFGYHIIKVTDIKSATFDSVKDQIFMEIRSENMSKNYPKAVESLMAKAKIEDLSPAPAPAEATKEAPKAPAAKK